MSLTTTTTRITAGTRITALLMATAAAAALTVPPASAMRAPDHIGETAINCSVWHRLDGLNPSVLKLRGDESGFETRRWVIECFG